MHLYLTVDYIYNTDMRYNVYLREETYFIYRVGTQTPPLMPTLSYEVTCYTLYYASISLHSLASLRRSHIRGHKVMAEGWEWSSKNAFATVSVSKSPLINTSPRRKAPDQMFSESPGFLHLLCLSLFLDDTIAKFLPHSTIS